jgi:hypothetical protein
MVQVDYVRSLTCRHGTGVCVLGVFDMEATMVLIVGSKLSCLGQEGAVTRTCLVMG